MKIARFFSYILHPAFMPIVGIYILFNSGIYPVNVSWEVKKYSYMLVGLFSILLPFSILPLIMYWKIINNYKLSDRKERFIPVFITAICLIVMHIILSRIVPIKIISAFTFAVALSAIVLLFINIFYKISMHLMGAGGLTGLIMSLTLNYNANPFLWLLILIFISGVSASSRLALKAHKPSEIISGYLLGLVLILGITSLQTSLTL